MKAKHAPAAKSGGKPTSLQAAENIGAMVSRGTRSTGKAAKVKKLSGKGKAGAPAKPGKTPSAKNVREALKSGHIKPAEAAELNPRGGLVPKAKDVNAALGKGHISYDEAKSLNPNAAKKK